MILTVLNKVTDELELKRGNNFSTSINDVDVKIADTSLSSSKEGIHVSSTSRYSRVYPAYPAINS